MKRRILSIVMAAALLLTLLPTAFADDIPGSCCVQLSVANGDNGAVNLTITSTASYTADDPIYYAVFTKTQWDDASNTWAGYEQNSNILDEAKIENGFDTAGKNTTVDISSMTSGQTGMLYIACYDDTSGASSSQVLEREFVDGKLKEPLDLAAITGPANLKVGQAITSIDVSDKASGGTTPYSFSSDDLSTNIPGLSISTAGVISGTPTTASSTTGTFNVTVTDGATPAVTKTVTVSYGAVAKGTATVALNGDASVPYKGSAYEPGVTVTLPGKTTATSDYTVAWAPTGLTDAGDYEGTVTLQGTAADNYEFAANTNKVDFKITQVKPTGTPTFNTFDPEGTDKTLAAVVKDIDMDQVFSGITADGKLAGTFEWTDSGVTDATTVAQGTTYNWKFTPTNTNYNPVTGTVTPWSAASQVDITFETDPAMGKIDVNGGVATTTMSVTIGDAIVFPEVKNTDATKYRFLGWTLDPDAEDVKVLTEAEMDAAVAAEGGATYTAVFALPDHEHYMIGVGGDQFNPNGGMTRAQAAVMLARLDGYDVDVPYGKDAGYTDIGDATAKWALNAINYVTDKGFMKGRGENTFDPDTPITRQEMAVILARFGGYAEDTTSPSFDDIDKAADWAKGYITALKAAGKINGYDNKNFGPTDKLTRAQAAKMVNYVLDRIPNEDKISKDELKFTDVKGMDNWAVYNVIEATVDHFSEDFH